MRASWIVVAAFASALIVGQPANGGELKTLNSLMIGREPKKAEIYRLPDELLTRVAVNPEYLRLHASYKVTIGGHPEEILGTLLSQKFAEDDRLTPDVRWGAVLYSEDGQEIVSIYVDKFGSIGYVNGRAVRFSTNLVPQLIRALRELH
jgi:hypothetical protein